MSISGVHGDARLLWGHAICSDCPSQLMTKFLKHRLAECSTCAMFFSSSFTVSIIARLRSSSLSDMLIKMPFILLFSLVISCIPSMKRRCERFFQKEIFHTTAAGSSIIISITSAFNMVDSQ